MLRTLTAREFLEPAERGGNYPVKLRGRDAEGVDVLVFVKTRAGYGSRPAAAGVELFTTLLARELGLLAPEPVLVNIQAGFERVVFDAPEHRELVAASHGVNFGTIALGPDWKTWPVEMSTRAFPDEMIEAILVFDGLAQQTDRESHNPNLMWRDRRIAILDHEKCFAHLRSTLDPKRPWREFFGLRPFQRHCLRGVGADLVNAQFGRTMREILIGLELEEKIPAIAKICEAAFPEAALELSRVVEYLDLLTRDASDFFDYFRMSLSR